MPTCKLGVVFVHGPETMVKGKRLWSFPSSMVTITASPTHQVAKGIQRPINRNEVTVRASLKTVFKIKVLPFKIFWYQLHVLMAFWIIVCKWLVLLENLIKTA